MKKQYEELLNDFDESYQQLQECLKNKSYAEATSIQGYLVGMIRTALLLCDAEAVSNAEFISNIEDRSILLN